MFGVGQFGHEGPGWPIGRAQSSKTLSNNDTPTFTLGASKVVLQSLSNSDTPSFSIVRSIGKILLASVSHAVTRQSVIAKIINARSQPKPPVFLASMTFSFVDSSSSVINLNSFLDDNGNSYSLKNNDFLIMVIGIGSTTDPNFAPDTGWTEDQDLRAADTSSANLALHYKFMGASPDTTVTVTGGGTNIGTSGVIFAFDKVDQNQTLDTSTAHAEVANTGVPDPPTATPITPGSMIVVAAVASIGAGNQGAVFTQGGDLDTATNHFRSIRITAASDGNVSGMGCVLWNNSGIFNPAAWGGGRSSTACAYVAVTAVLRPAHAKTGSSNTSGGALNEAAGVALINIRQPWALSISSTLTSTIVRQTGKILSISATLASTIVRQISKIVTASAQGNGTISRSATKTLLLAASVTASMVRSTGKIVALAASVVASIATVFTSGSTATPVTLSSSQTPTFSISKVTGKTLSLAASVNALLSSGAVRHFTLAASGAGNAFISRASQFAHIITALVTTVQTAGRTSLATIRANVPAVATISRRTNKIVTVMVGTLAQLFRLLNSVASAVRRAIVGFNERVAKVWASYRTVAVDSQDRSAGVSSSDREVTSEPKDRDLDIGGRIE